MTKNGVGAVHSLENLYLAQAGARPITQNQARLAETMLSFLKKDPIKKLEKQYQKLLSDAMQEQRKGDIRAYSDLVAKSEKLAKQIDDLKQR